MKLFELIIAFGLGILQGALIMDWRRNKQEILDMQFQTGTKKVGSGDPRIKPS